MGYMSTITILNDGLDQIKDDPDFGRKVYEAIMNYKNSNRHHDNDISSGNHCNVANVVAVHHADDIHYLRIGENMGEIMKYERSLSGGKIVVKVK